MSGGRRPASGVGDNLPNIIDLPPRDLPQINVTMPFSLTLYDAAYLELAQRRSLPLATLDQDLRAAAPMLSIELLGT